MAEIQLLRTAVPMVALVVMAACTTSGDVATTEPTFAETSTSPPTFAPTTTVAGADTTTTVAAAETTTSILEAEPAPDLPPPSPGAMAQLDQLVVAPEGSGAGYDRDLFGGGWIDADRDGCDTRCEVLAEERRTDLPGLPGGGWLSIYDGYTTDDPSELDIDHVVALGEAWRSGADQWDSARRVAFANDLDDPDALIAVSASTNRSKSDRDPASWQPPNLDGWCPFASAWINTKHRWGLTADQAEVDALRNMLTSRGC